MIISKVISNFNTGEISPHLAARAEFDKYHAGFEILENFQVLPQGPITRRIGTRFVAETKYSSKKSRLVKFQFNVTDTYVLEFGDYYIRFYKGTAQLGAPYEIATPYGEGDIWGLMFEQSADILYIFHDDHRPRKLSRTGDTSWTLSKINFKPPPSYVDNTDLGIACTPGTGADAAGTEDVTFTLASAGWHWADAGRAIISGAARAIITDVTSTTVVNATIVDSWPNTTQMSAGSWHLTGSPVAAITPEAKAPIGKKIYVIMTENDATPKSVSAAYSGTTITITYTSHNLSTNDWVLMAGAAVGSYNGIFKITFIDANTFTYTAKSAPNAAPGGTLVCSVGFAGFRTADVGKYIKGNDGLIIIRKYENEYLVKAEILSVLKDKSTGYAGEWSLEVESFGGKDLAAEKTVTSITRTGNTATATVTAHGYSAADSVVFYGANQTGYNDVIKLISAATDTFTFFVEDTIVTPATGTIKCRKCTPSFPTAAVFHQNRLFLASTRQQPQSKWGSITGDYENFAVGTKDDNALDRALTTQNRIRWMTATKNIVIGTYGEEMVAGTKDNSAITPTNEQVFRQTTYGSAKIQPIVVGNVIIFVQRSGYKLREFLYSFMTDDYQATDLTQLANHITSPFLLGLPDWNLGGIVDMTQQKEPNSYIFAVRADGVLLCLTYDKLSNIYAWSRFITDGVFESIVSVPASGRERVWAIVKRTINGATKRYVEYFDDEAWGVSSGWKWAPLLTDCAKTYNFSPAQVSVTGLSHLEGKTVNVLGDGLLQASKVVTSGAITLDTAASHVEVGLSYQSHALTVRPEANMPDGTMQGRMKGWAEIVLRLYQTLGGYANEEAMEYNVEAGVRTPFTGDYHIRNLGYDEGGRICIRQPDPLPMTVLAIAGKLMVE